MTEVHDVWQPCSLSPGLAFLLYLTTVSYTTASTPCLHALLPPRPPCLHALPPRPASTPAALTPRPDSTP